VRDLSPQIMKTFLVTLCAVFLYACGLHAQSALVRGDYFGMLVPIGTCANERLGIEMHVTADGGLTGRIRDWDDSTVITFNTSWPWLNGRRFTTDITGLSDTVRGAFTSTGVCRGTVKFENGCKYSFVMYRRYKVQP